MLARGRGSSRRRGRAFTGCKLGREGHQFLEGTLHHRSFARGLFRLCLGWDQQMELRIQHS